MDAVRAEFYGDNIEAAHRNQRKITLKVWFLREHGDWALTSVEPLDVGGKPVAEPRWVLLRRSGGRWEDVKYFDVLRPFASDEAADDALDMTAATIERVVAKFPDVPRDIFPDPRGQRP